MQVANKKWQALHYIQTSGQEIARFVKPGRDPDVATNEHESEVAFTDTNIVYKLVLPLHFHSVRLAFCLEGQILHKLAYVY
jgi:hypothetical protein